MIVSTLLKFGMVLKLFRRRPLTSKFCTIHNLSFIVKFDAVWTDICRHEAIDIDRYKYSEQRCNWTFQGWESANKGIQDGHGRGSVERRVIDAYSKLSLT